MLCSKDRKAVRPTGPGPDHTTPHKVYEALGLLSRRETGQHVDGDVPNGRSEPRLTQTEHKVHNEVEKHSHNDVPPWRSRTASSADWPQCPLPSVSLAIHCTAPVPCAGAKLPPRPVPGCRAETGHSSPGQVGTNAGGKGITYSGWQKPKKKCFLR